MAIRLGRRCALPATPACSMGASTVTVQPMPSRRLEYTRRAFKDLAAMPKDDAAGMVGALERYAETGEGDLRKLRPNEWGLRWGDWRAIYSPNGQILTVLRVGNRKEVYR